MLFALIREVVAGLLLLLWAAYCDGRQSIRRRRDCWLFLACGFFIFTNQAAFIVGDKLAGPVLASAWQPTQPVFTLVISWLIGWERLTIGKAVGIGLSVGGAAFMVTYGADLGGGSGTTEVVAGNVLFFFNCLGTSLYVITCKLVLARGYPPSTITAWSYLCGALMMLITASALNSSCRAVSLLCPPPSDAPPSHQCDDLHTSCDPWAVPASALLPLAYWILFNSAAAYLLMTWANKHAAAGFVLAYCALQPLTSTTLSVAIVQSGAHTNLSMPGWNALGALPIVLGLVLILRDGKSAHDGVIKQPADASAVVSNRDPLLVAAAAEPAAAAARAVE